MLKEVIIFISGVGIGAGVTALILTKSITKREQKIADDKISSHNEYVKDLEERVRVAEGAIRERYSGEDGSKNGDSGDRSDTGSENDSKKSEKKEKNSSSGKILQVDYTSYYKNRAENEHPEDDLSSEMTLEEETEELNSENYRKKPPEVIEKEDYEDSSTDYFDKIQLYYYTEDEILATEEDEIVDNVMLSVGNLITSTGFNKNKDIVMYVRNYNLGVDYEIDKMYGAFQDR